MVNYLRGCPREAVREVYYGRVLKGISERYKECREIEIHQEFICKIALNSLIDVLLSNVDIMKVEHLMDDILESIYKDYFIVHFVKFGRYL